jgi:hypothetical protein
VLLDPVPFSEYIILAAISFLCEFAWMRQCSRPVLRIGTVKSGDAVTEGISLTWIPRFLKTAHNPMALSHFCSASRPLSFQLTRPVRTATTKGRTLKFLGQFSSQTSQNNNSSFKFRYASTGVVRASQMGIFRRVI